MVQGYETGDSASGELGRDAPKYLATPVRGEHVQASPLMEPREVEARMGILGYKLWNGIAVPAGPNPNDPQADPLTQQFYIFQCAHPSAGIDEACARSPALLLGRHWYLARPHETVIIPEADLGWLVSYNRSLASVPPSREELLAQWQLRTELRMHYVRPGESAVVGRARGAVFHDLFLDAPYVSRRQFGLEVGAAGDIRLIEMGKNPTYVLRARQPWEQRP